MMMTREDAIILFAENGERDINKAEFSFDKAEGFYNNDWDKVMLAMHIFYGTAPAADIKTNFMDPRYEFDHHEQDMMELYSTPGGQYDPDTGVWCVPRRRC